MTINDTTQEIQKLFRTTDLTQSEIARKVNVSRQRVHHVRLEMDENPYVGFDGSKLKERRELQKLSMSALARKMKVSTSQVSRWESGAQTPWPSSWRKLARALRCTVEDFEKEGVTT